MTIDDIFTAGRTNVALSNRITAGEVTTLPEENYQSAHGHYTKHVGVVKFTYNPAKRPTDASFCVESILGKKVYRYENDALALINTMLAECGDGIIRAAQLLLEREKAYLAHAVMNGNEVSGELYLSIALPPPKSAM